MRRMRRKSLKIILLSLLAVIVFSMSGCTAEEPMVEEEQVRVPVEVVDMKKRYR